MAALTEGQVKQSLPDTSTALAKRAAGNQRRTRRVLGSLRVKITIVSLLSMLLVAGSIFFSSFIGQRQLLGALDDEVLANQRLMLGKLLNVEFTALNTQLRGMKSDNVVQALATQDKELLERYVMPRYNRISSVSHVDRLWFFTNDNREFFRAHASTNEPLQTDVNRLTLDTLRDKKILQGIGVDRAAVSLYVASPIYHKGDVVGVMVVGSALLPVLEDLATTLDANVSFASRDARISGEDVSQGPYILHVNSDASETLHDPLINTLQSRDLGEASFTNRLGEHFWRTNVLPIQGYRGDVLGHVFVSSDITQVSSFLNANAVRNIVISFAGFALALLVILLSVNRSFMRLDQMVGAIAQFAKGDLHVKVPDPKFSELQILGKALEAMIRDVGRTQAELIESERRANDANLAKSAFLANVTHELRTPMNAILGYAEILRDDFIERADRQRQNDVEHILDSARRLLGIINDLIEISKIEAGKIDLAPQAVDVASVIEEVSVFAQREAQKNCNEFTVESLGAQRLMYADPQRTIELLGKLVSNAAKFTHNGRICMRVTEEMNNPSRIVFSVSDTGIGIEEADADRLFQPFSQVDESITRGHDGAGLGLVISKKLCELMGGAISMESRVGEGSTFTVKLPANKEAA